MVDGDFDPDYELRFLVSGLLGHLAGNFGGVDVVSISSLLIAFAVSLTFFSCSNKVWR